MYHKHPQSLGNSCSWGRHLRPDPTNSSPQTVCEICMVAHEWLRQNSSEYNWFLNDNDEAFFLGQKEFDEISNE